MKRQFIVPIALSVFALLFIIIVFFFISRPHAQESLSLSVVPSANEASALSAVTSARTGASGNTNVASTPAPQDALTALRAIPQASTFVSLLESTGVASQLSPAGTYTFFVPTNAAFAASPLGPVAGMSAADRLRLAEYHIVSGKMMSIDAVKSGYITMLSRDALNANVFDTAQVGGNTHIIATYPAPDGIIYLIDIVLQPPVVRPFPF